MIKKDQIFQLKLEDYSRPRYMSALKSYYGTMDDLIAFMIRLEDNPNTCTRYKDTLHAAEFFDLDNEVDHTIAGQTLPVFVPVKELSAIETVLHDPSWVYTTYSGAQYPCKASQIELRQTLIQTDTCFERSVQAGITGLQVCYPCIGWVCPNGNVKGFPGMITYDGNTYSMALAAAQAHYDFEEYDWAMRDAMNVSTVDLGFLVADILAEG